MDTFKAGLEFTGIPDCAIPKPAYFQVEGAEATKTLRSVIVSFNRALNLPTAETASNYCIEPSIEVTVAEVSPTNNQEVILAVEGLEADSDYVLTVSNVLSEEDVPLNSERNTASFRTGDNQSVTMRTVKQ